jgi:hypothetical protein
MRSKYARFARSIDRFRRSLMSDSGVCGLPRNRDLLDAEDLPQSYGLRGWRSLPFREGSGNSNRVTRWLRTEFVGREPDESVLPLWTRVWLRR